MGAAPSAHARSDSHDPYTCTSLRGRTTHRDATVIPEGSRFRRSPTLSASQIFRRVPTRLDDRIETSSDSARFLPAPAGKAIISIGNYFTPVNCMFHEAIFKRTPLLRPLPALKMGSCSGGASSCEWPGIRSSLGVALPATDACRTEAVGVRGVRGRSWRRRRSIIAPAARCPSALTFANRRGADTAGATAGRLTASPASEATTAFSGRWSRVSSTTVNSAWMPCWAR